MAQKRPAIRLPDVFIDSSVFFTAVNSPTGGSAKIFSLSGSQFHLCTSRIVLVETERNVRKKLLNLHLPRFFMLSKHVHILNHIPRAAEIAAAQRVIAKKDAVILAEAKHASIIYVVTLDVKHFITNDVKQFLHPVKIVTPKELLTLKP
ncbi:MAG TPA: PIN domain-containing protein [Patescibacteria group bacterium]|nr:PIN domain-containing protein [Patescibacteria group bacterium]